MPNFIKEKTTPAVNPASTASAPKPAAVRLQAWKAKIREKYRHMQAERLHNQQNDRVLNLILTWLFPVFIVCLAELNQFVQVSEFLEFCMNRTSVLIFDFIMAYLLYCFILVLTNRVWIAAWVQGLLYMTISVVELFKFSTNGNHFKLVDLSLAPNVKNLTSFAYIQITLPLVIYVLLLFLVLGVMFWQNPAFTAPLRKRVISAAACLGTYVAVICVPGISHSVYGVFKVDTSASENAFSTNEKFNNNSMLAFIVETTSEKLADSLRKPEGYDAAMMQQALTAPAKPQNSDYVQPNVIVVMSEAFADFRALEAIELETDAYAPFDAVAADSVVLRVAVPTFASYTVRTEFELLFGLPVRSLMDTITPQAEIIPKAPSSFVSYYRDLGYQTAYVHPFTRTFYNRDRIYNTFGFDTMLFDEDLTVPVETYPNGYVSDATVFAQLQQLLKDHDQPMFIHTTTMQNHQPYNWIENGTELDIYLEGIRATGEALKDFTDALSESGEPTVLLFVGDHFPSMRAEGNLYSAMGIDSQNCTVLYEQTALIWSNFALQTDSVPDSMISAFYLNNLILEMTGAPVDPFYATVMEQSKEYPVYASIFLEESQRSAVLDLLTYDRIVGENYTGTRPLDADS